MSAIAELKDDIVECSDCELDGFNLCAQHSEVVPVKKPGRGEELVEAIHATERPVSTPSDLADDLGVTVPTIHNHQNHLLKHPSVQHRKVGQTMIFWPEENSGGDKFYTTYIPPEIFKRASERDESVREYLLALVSLEKELGELYTGSSE